MGCYFYQTTQATNVMSKSINSNFVLGQYTHSHQRKGGEGHLVNKMISVHKKDNETGLALY